jgi:hypothetical protein
VTWVAILVIILSFRGLVYIKPCGARILSHPVIQAVNTVCYYTAIYFLSVLHKINASRNKIH